MIQYHIKFYGSKRINAILKLQKVVHIKSAISAIHLVQCMTYVMLCSSV